MTPLYPRKLAASRAGAAAASADEIPPDLERELHRLTVPSIQTTPTGPAPSRADAATIRRLRDWRARPYRPIYRALRLRIERGEAVEAVVAPLYTLAAAIATPIQGDLQSLCDDDAVREGESNAAMMRYLSDPNESHRLTAIEAESRELQISLAKIRLLMEVRR